MNKAVPRTSQGDVPIHQIVLEGMSAGVIVVDVTGRIDYLNPAAERMFRLDLLEVRGRPLRDFVQPPNEMDRLSELRTHIVANGGWDGELRLNRNGSEGFTVRCNASLLRDAQGEPSAIVVVAEELHADNRTEAALLEALEQFRALAECMPSLVRFSWDDGRPSWYNPRFLEFSGLSYRELERRGWRQLIHPDDQEIIPAAGVREPWEAEIRMRRHDGQYRWMMVRTARVLDGRGQVIGFVGIAADIHERRMAEAEARAAHAQLDAIWETSPVGLALLDADLRFVRVNETMATMGRLSPKEYLGKQPPEVLARVTEHFRQFSGELKATGKPILRRERGFEVEGEQFYRLDSWVPLYDSAGALTGVAVACEDITAQKGAQAAAEQALRELDAIYQGAPIGLAVMDRDLRFLRVNERLAQMNGLPVPDHIGRAAIEVVPTVRGQGREAVEAVRRGETVIGLELSGESRNRPGERRDYLENWVPLKNDAGEVVGVSIAVEDVTERKRAESELNAGREHLQRVLDTLPEAVVMTDAAGEVTFADQQWIERTGLNPATCSKEELQSVVHPEDRERIDERWRIARSSQRPFTATYRVRQKDASYRWQISRAVPLLDANGDVAEWIGTLADIDDEKQNQEALATALAELDITYRTAPVGLGVLDLDLRYIRLNEQLASVSGLPVEELIGKSVAELVPDIAEAVRAVRDQIVQTGEAVLSIETEGFAPGPGEYLYCQENWIPIKDDKGDVIAISVSVEDVTSLKRAEQALQAKHAELDAVFQTSPVGLALLDRDLRFVRVNEWLAELNRTTAEDHIGRTIREVAPHQGDYSEAMARRVLAGDRVVGDTRESVVDGVRTWAQISWVPVRDDVGEIVGIGLAVEDVTPLKRAELRLQAALAELGTTYRFAPVGLAVFDLEGRFVRVNERLAAMHGLPTWEHIGRPSAEVLGAGDWAGEIVARAAAAGEPLLRAEVSAAIPVGTDLVRHLRVSCAPMRNQRDEVFAIATAVEDITDMKENETLLLESEHRLRTILDAVPAAIGVTNSVGQLFYLNRHWLDYSGMDLIGAKTEDLAGTFEPGELEAVLARWTRALEEAEPFELVQRLRRVDGEYRWHLGRIVPMRDAGGKVTGWVSTNIDIHDRKTTEEQLEAALGEIEATYQGAPIGLAVVDRELRYVRVNEVLAAANGMPAWRHAGRRLGDLARCPAQQVEAIAQDVLGTGEARLSVELEAVPRRGRPRTWRFSMVPLRDAQREIIGVSIAAEDVTARKRADDEVRAAKDHLRKILDSIPAPVIVLDDSGLLRFGNTRFWEYT
ncbi:MAG: PAS domain-containing protein, partial [Tepidiformaceae bacterium]